MSVLISFISSIASCLKKVLSWLFGIQQRYYSDAVYDWSITVLIPAYNEVENISRTIRSVKEQTHRVDRILVVDDCSTDRTGDLAGRLGADVIRMRAQSGKKGRAQNYALQFVDTDIIVTVDADTVLDPDAVEKLLPPLADPKVASSCGFILPYRTKTVWEKARFVEYLLSLFLYKEGENLWGATVISPGCFSAFRRDALIDFGGMPVDNVLEDVDLTWRHYEAGYKVVMVPEAKCWVLSPPNYQFYQSQVDRWVRGGWLQSMASHGARLFTNKKLGFFIYISLIGNLYSLFLYLVLVPVFIMRSSLWKVFLNLLLVEWGFSFLLTSVVALREQVLFTALKCLPFYWLVQPINIFLWWRSVWREWILGRRLGVWTKGH